MNLCCLSTRQQDNLFLQSHIVWLPIEIPSAERDGIVPGAELVIQLTNRKKYKGVIKMIDLIGSDDRLAGSIAVQKK